MQISCQSDDSDRAAMKGPEGTRFLKRKLPLQALLEGCCGCSVADELGVACVLVVCCGCTELLAAGPTLRSETTV